MKNRSEEFRQELNKLELSLSSNWAEYSDRLYEIFIISIYLRILPNLDKERFISLNKKVVNKNNSSLESYLSFFGGNDWSANIDNLLKITKEIFLKQSNYCDLFKISANSTSDVKTCSEFFIDDEDDKNISLFFDNESDEDEEKKQKQLENEQNIEKNKLLYKSICQFIRNINIDFSEEELRLGFKLYFFDSIARNSHIYNNINIDKIIFNRIEQILPESDFNLFVLGKTNQLNLIDLLEKRNRYKLFFEENILDTITEVILNIYNISYQLNYVEQGSTYLIYDMTSPFNHDKSILFNQLSFINSLLKDKTNYAFLFFKKDNYEKRIISRIINEIISLTLLRNIVYSTKSEFVAVEVAVARKSKLENVLSVIESDNSLGELASSSINYEQVKDSAIDLLPFFVNSTKRYMLSEITSLITGSGSAKKVFSRKNTNKIENLDENRIPVLREKDLINTAKESIDINELQLTDYFITKSIIDKTSVVFCLSNDKVIFKLFHPIPGFDKLLLGQNVFAFQIATDLLKIEELFDVLKAEKFQLQIVSLFNNVRSTIRKIEILNEQQISIDKNELEKIKVQKEIQLQKDILNNLRHNTSTKIENSLYNIEKIKDFVVQNDLSNELIMKPPEKLINIIEETERSINYFSKYLKNTKEIFLEIDKERFEEINIVDLLTTLKEERRLDNFEISIIPKDDKKYYIKANPIHFRAIFDNLLDNANKYAFERKLEENEVKIKVEGHQNKIIINFRNNGKKFTLTKEEFITSGKTTDKNSTGFGGSLIEKYVKAFNGELKIIPSENMEIEFTFNLTKENSNEN